MASERTNVMRLVGLPDVATDLLELGAEVTIGLVVHVGAGSSSIELHAKVAGVETQPPPSCVGSITRTVRLVAADPEPPCGLCGEAGCRGFCDDPHP